MDALNVNEILTPYIMDWKMDYPYVYIYMNVLLLLLVILLEYLTTIKYFVLKCLEKNKNN